ncbi:hypothetical protein D3C79_856460 [compost metagenome]
MQHGDIRRRSLIALAVLAAGIGVHNYLVACILPALLYDAYHVRRVEQIDQFSHCVPYLTALHVHRRSHLADVEVLADVKRFLWLYRLMASTLLALIGIVYSAGREVDEFAINIGVDQLRWVCIVQRRNVVARQVLSILSGAGLGQ